MQKSFFFLITGVCAAVLIIIGSLLFFGGREDVVVPPQTEERPVVAVSIFPLAEIVRAIAGNDADVITLIPENVEPHDAEPSAQAVARAQTADILALVGSHSGDVSIDAWANDLAQTVEERGGRVVLVVPGCPIDDAGDCLPSNPHIWLDLEMMQFFVEKTRDALMQEDPERATEYAARATTLTSRLFTLDRQYKTKLANCTLRDVVVTHDAFLALEWRYNIRTHAALGVVPDEEPSARGLAELVEQIRTLGVKVVFFEEAASPAIAQTLANEAGVAVDVLSPIEMGEPDPTLQAEGYFAAMEANLAALSRAMMCQP